MPIIRSHVMINILRLSGRLLTPVRIVVRIPVVAAAAGAKLAQIVEVSSEHIAVTPTYPVGLGQVFEVVNCLVKLTGIEFAPSPPGFEILEVPGNFVEVLSLMTVETSALGGPIEVGHYAAYQLRVSSVAIPAIVIIAVAVSIIRIVPRRIVRVLPPGLRIRRHTQGQNSAAE
jgi:hypothetical protein